MKKEFRILLIVAVQIAVYVGIVVSFAFYIDYQVDEEYRLGLRTGNGGDKIIIPIFGLALYLLIFILLANILYFLGRFVWRKQNYFT
jgi:hypothetical protein